METQWLQSIYEGSDISVIMVWAGLLNLTSPEIQEIQELESVFSSQNKNEAWIPDAATMSETELQYIESGLR